MTLPLIDPGPSSKPWELRLGDCIQGMAALADKSVDHTIADPPFEEEAHTKGRRICTGSFLERRSGSDTTMVKPISYPPITEAERAAAAAQIARVTRRWIVLFCQVEAAMLWRRALEAGGAEYVRCGSWHKTDAQPQLTGDRPGQGWEAVVICHGARAAGGAASELPLLQGTNQPHAGRMRWNGGGHCAKWSGSSRNTGGDLSRKKLIDGQKPDWLMERLVSDFSDPGELVFDPYAGSGSTGAACIKLGRRFLGFERTPHTHALAVARLAALSMPSAVGSAVVRSQFPLGVRP